MYISFLFPFPEHFLYEPTCCRSIPVKHSFATLNEVSPQSNRLTYFPSCLIVGIIISLLSIAILVVLLVPKLRERALDLLQAQGGKIAVIGL